MSDLQAFAAFAEALADAARAATLRYLCGGWDLDDKGRRGVFDPVTRADRDAELAMRTMIEARWPDHGIQGEEFGDKPASGRYVWSLDPIDGTRSFICGLPTWTVLIALLEEGRPIVGVIDAPALGERYIGYGEVGEMLAGTSRRRISTSRCRSLGEARLSTTDPYLFPPGEQERFERVRLRGRLTRFGLDGYAYARLAAGGLDLVIESGLAPHDLNALVPVVTAAGGALSDWSGTTDFSTGQVVAAASAELLDEAVALLLG